MYIHNDDLDEIQNGWCCVQNMYSSIQYIYNVDIVSSHYISDYLINTAPVSRDELGIFLRGLFVPYSSPKGN